MDSQEIDYPQLNLSRVQSIRSLNCSTEMFFSKGQNQLKQANSPSKKSKLDAILHTLKTFKNSQSTTDLHSEAQVSEKRINPDNFSLSKKNESSMINKESQLVLIEEKECIKKKYQMNSPSKKYLQTQKKEENSFSYEMKQVRSVDSLKKLKQSQIIMIQNDISGYETSNKNLLRQKSPKQIFSLEFQKNSLEAIKEKLQKYGINTSKHNKKPNQSRINMNKSQRYPQAKKNQRQIQDLRLASSGQISPALIQGTNDKLKEKSQWKQEKSTSRLLTSLKEQNLSFYEPFPVSPTGKLQNKSVSVKNLINEDQIKTSPIKSISSNSMTSAKIHAKFFDINMQNFTASGFQFGETIAPKKSGSYGNQKSKLSQSESYGTTLKQKPGSWGHKRCFKSAFQQISSLSINSNLSLYEKPQCNLKQTIETNFTVDNFERKLALKDFILGRQIGKGKFGRVYICTHRYSGFLCAMKIIKKDMIRKQRNIEQLIREVKIQMYVNHSNSVKMYAFFDDTQNIYLLIEYCVDGQLYSLLKTKKRFEEEEAIPIIKDICEGLHHLHENNIIHRDIKPENVVISFQMSKLCDFGWSVNSQNEKIQTFCGTPLYVSPELLMGKTYDYKVDIWALGIMVYELLTGKLPFQITNEKELRKIVTNEVRYPEHLSKNAKNFIQHLLQKNPSYRNDMETILKHKFLVEDMEKNKLKNKAC